MAKKEESAQEIIDDAGKDIKKDKRILALFILMFPSIISAMLSEITGLYGWEIRAVLLFGQLIIVWSFIVDKW
jgi:hypothetical protein